MEHETAFGRRKVNRVGTVLWWIRRDVRLADNHALTAAVSNSDAVVPVFVVDDRLLTSRCACARRADFLWHNLRSLDVQLRRRGSYLVVRRGSPVEQLRMLMETTGAVAIYAEEDYSPFARERDNAVAEVLPLRLTGGVVVHAPGTVLKADGGTYTVFTPFSRAWKALPLPRADGLLPAPADLNTPAGLETLSLPAEHEAEGRDTFVPGEAEGMRRLREFVLEPAFSPPVYQYSEGRNRLDRNGTSGLSPYLRFGVISAHQAVVSVMEAMAAASHSSALKGAETWLNELIWREFYIHILAHFPSVRKGAFRPNMQSIPWLNRQADFDAWKAGRTGFPVVDAGLRQLASTGWMHNRARMIAASFLVKDLLIDWRWGERWFMQQLVDGDPASNNGGWQWTAGTGTDAAPYFRVFNPVLQSVKFDPQGMFIRRWLPELEGVPDKHIHEPWRMSASEQQSFGCVIGRDYPAPMVDHKAARSRALAAYGEAKDR